MTIYSNRRQFLQTSLAVTAIASTAMPARAAGIATRYADLQTRKYLGRGEVLAEIKDDKVFTEGPAWAADGRLLFTNVPAAKILAWSEKSRELTLFRQDSNLANGLYFDPAGQLLACEGGAGRVTRTDLKSGTITVVADEFNNFPFASPNDVCLDGVGRIFFTSRPGGEDPTKGNVNAVYRIDPDGTVDQVLKWPDIHMPNGIVTSPDNSTLYLIEAHPDADQHRDIRAYDIHEDGSLGNQRVLIDFYPGRSGDGMCIDAEGNLYVAAGLHATRETSETLDTRPGIHVISPQGELLAYQPTPVDTITNCAFGGKDLRSLYITCGKFLLRMRSKIPGKPAYWNGERTT
jgi:gluconolactonase